MIHSGKLKKNIPTGMPTIEPIIRPFTSRKDICLKEVDTSINVSVFANRARRGDAIAKGSKRTNNGMPKRASAKPKAPLTKLIKNAIVPMRSKVFISIKRIIDVFCCNQLLNSVFCSF